LSEPTGKTARRRRTAEEARREILDAAQVRLAAGGPEAVRLQDIAADLGISHPAILHHFETREGLLQALSLRTMEELNDSLVRDIEAGQLEPGEGIERVFQVLSQGEAARLLAWRVLSGRADLEPPSRQHMRELVEAVHCRIEEHARSAGTVPPSYEEVACCMRLASAAMFGDAILGSLLNQSSGVDEAFQKRYRRWFDELITLRLMGRSK
jgi:AcrR family transcriptional regulator